jgi:DNA primase catalytic subunit
MEKVFQVIQSICAFLGDSRTKDEIEKMLEPVLKKEKSEERWLAIQELFEKKKDDKSKRIWGMINRELTIGLLYPKIDAHVSAQTNHLLKCPFNVHHATGKLSLPILDIENFDVQKCPTIFDALENKDLLKNYLAVFDKFCEGITKTTN